MTFQPPPGNTPPPPPPPGYGGPAGSGGFDPKSVNPLDWAIVGIGAVMLIFSFFSYYTADYAGVSYGGKTYGGGSVSIGAWHTSGGTFVPWLAMIVGVAGAVIIALELFVPSVHLPFAARLIALLAFTASLVLYLIGFAAVDLGGASFGFSYWLSFILAIAGTALTLMRAQQTNTALPGPLSNIPKIGR